MIRSALVLGSVGYIDGGGEGGFNVGSLEERFDFGRLNLFIQEFRTFIRLISAPGVFPAPVVSFQTSTGLKPC